MFDGFYRPRANFYRLPNDWFDIWRELRETTGRNRVLAPLKAVAYTIKWTWGYQNFEEPVRLAWRDFQFGRREDGRRLDRGTGLSSGHLEETLTFVERVGLLEIVHREGDDGPSFLPRLRPSAEDPPGFLGQAVEIEGEKGEPFPGFDDPTANYFKLPAIWTDLTRDVKSETLILAVEYFFRHTWGWQGGDGPRWMEVDDVADGRRYRSAERSGERYDRGIGYSRRSVRKALKRAVERGWLVWRPKGRGRGREYALHLQGMRVADDGRWLGAAEDAEHANQQKPVSVGKPSQQSPGSRSEGQTPSSDPSSEPTAMEAEVLRLRRQVAALERTMSVLLELLRQAGVDVHAALPEASEAETEGSEALTERSEAETEGSEAETEGSEAPLIQTLQEDTSPTPPPDTSACRGDGGGGGAGGVASSEPQLIGRLTGLDAPMSPERAAALIAEYGAASVGAWLDVLEDAPGVRNVAGLLVHKLQNGETPPDNGRTTQDPGRDEACPYCHGTGTIRIAAPAAGAEEPDRIPCPHCTPNALEGGASTPPTR